MGWYTLVWDGPIRNGVSQDALQKLTGKLIGKLKLSVSKPSENSTAKPGILMRIK